MIERSHIDIKYIAMSQKQNTRYALMINARKGTKHNMYQVIPTNQEATKTFQSFRLNIKRSASREHDNDHASLRTRQQQPFVPQPMHQQTRQGAGTINENNNNNNPSPIEGIKATMNHPLGSLSPDPTLHFSSRPIITAVRVAKSFTFGADQN